MLKLKLNICEFQNFGRLFARREMLDCWCMQANRILILNFNEKKYQILINSQITRVKIETIVIWTSLSRVTSVLYLIMQSYTCILYFLWFSTKSLTLKYIKINKIWSALFFLLLFLSIFRCPKQMTNNFVVQCVLTTAFVILICSWMEKIIM